MSEFVPQFFYSHDGRFAVTLDISAIRVMVGNSATAHRMETGGILIGRYDIDHSTAIVVESTPKPKDSVFNWFSFRRGSSGLKQLLIKRWNVGLHYLGEWHYHPGGSSEPSNSDHHAMAKIAENPKYDCHEPILVIIGGRPPEMFEFSVTVYPVAQNHVRLLQVLSYRTTKIS